MWPSESKTVALRTVGPWYRSSTNHDRMLDDERCQLIVKSPERIKSPLTNRLTGVDALTEAAAGRDGFELIW